MASTSPLLIILNILSAVISTYMLLIVIRVFLTWFQGSHQQGRAFEILSSLVDPYLNWFRRFSFLRLGVFDLTPVAGMMVLMLANMMLENIVTQGNITLGFILAVFIGVIWSVFRFLLYIIILISVIRLLSFYFSRNHYSPVWARMDALLNPITARTIRSFTSQTLDNKTTLILTALLFIALVFLGNMAIRALTQLVLQIPV